MQEVRAPERLALEGTFPTDAAEAGGSIPEIPCAAASVGSRMQGRLGGVSPQRRRDVPSWMCAFAAVSQQPGSITLRAEACPIHINNR